MKKAGTRRARTALRPRGASASRTPSKVGPARSNRPVVVAQASRGGPAAPPERFPHLRAFLTGYLHQDFLCDHRTPGDALRAFLAEASAAERRALRGDVRAFLAATGGAPWREALETFLGLGGAWLPPSRRALLGLLDGVD